MLGARARCSIRDVICIALRGSRTSDASPSGVDLVLSPSRDNGDILEGPFVINRETTLSREYDTKEWELAVGGTGAGETRKMFMPAKLAKLCIASESQDKGVSVRFDGPLESHALDISLPGPESAMSLTRSIISDGDIKLAVGHGDVSDPSHGNDSVSSANNSSIDIVSLESNSVSIQLPENAGGSLSAKRIAAKDIEIIGGDRIDVGAIYAEESLIIDSPMAKIDISSLHCKPEYLRVRCSEFVSMSTDCVGEFQEEKGSETDLDIIASSGVKVLNIESAINSSASISSPGKKITRPLSENKDDGGEEESAWIKGVLAKFDSQGSQQ